MKPSVHPAARWFARMLWLLTLVIGSAAIWQLVALRQQSRRLESLHERHAQLGRDIAQLQQATKRDRSRLAAALQELETLAAAQAAPASPDSELAAWLGRVSRLKDWLRQSPDKAIPEMQYLSSNDWLAATLDNPLESEAAIRTALSRLRRMAKMKPEVAANIANAIGAYAHAHNGEAVPDPMALVPYLKTPLSAEILQRYEPVPEIAGKNDENGVSFRKARFIGSGRGVLWEKTSVDEDYDTQTIFMKQGGFTNYSVSKLGDAVDAASVAFARANPGLRASQPEHLLPYLTAPVDERALREYWAVKDRR